MKNKPDMTKDLIGYVDLTSGDKIAVYMPTIGDIAEMMMGQISSENTTNYLGAKSVGLTLDEFRSLPMTDGLRILGILGPAFDAFTKYASGK